MGFAEMLHLGIYGPLPDKQEQATAKIIESTEYLTGLVNELLDQAQLEAGRLKLKISRFSPIDIVDDTISKLNVLAQAKGLTLTTDIAPDVPVLLSGDPARLQQILVNLVSNAIKFTRAGEVQVRLYRPDPGHWALQVCDTGPGIPAEAQTYIFEAFRQVDGSATRLHTGTGLGLSIVKQLTTLMGGEVILESEVGRGSIFTVQLPLQLVAEPTG
jgi:signal transduction histidine kinase